MTSNSRVHLQLLLMAIIWAGQFIAGRWVASQLPPMTAGALRFVAASVTLLVLLRVLEGGLPRLGRRQFAQIVVLALAGVAIWNLCFFSALQTISAGRGALIIALSPIAVAVGATVFQGERRGPLGWIGVALALLGATVVITRGDLRTTFTGAFGAGETFMLGCVIGWAIYTLVGRTLYGGLSPLAVTTWAALVGTVLLLLGSLTEFDRIDLARLDLVGWTSIAYLGVLGTGLSFYWFSKGVQQLGPAQAAIYINLVPVFAVTYATVFLGEPVLASMVIGGVLVLIGVLMVTRR